MPTYFFNVRGTHRDDVGTDLTGINDARFEATNYLAENIRSDPAALVKDGAYHLEVSDEMGSVVFVIHVMALDVPPSRVHSPDDAIQLPRLPSRRK